MAAPTTAISGTQTPPAQQPSGSSASIPFTKASTFRMSQFSQSLITVGASQQPVAVDIPGVGFIEGFDIIVEGTAVAPVQGPVVFNEDAPHCVFANIRLEDTNGPSINLTNGWNLYLCDIFGQTPRSRWDVGPEGSTIQLRPILFTMDAATGSFKFILNIPVALNHRNLVGLLGNQDRGLTYRLTTDVAPLDRIYDANPPQSLVLKLTRVYRNYAKPATTNANGAGQAQYPAQYGIIRYLTEAVNPTAPAGGVTEFFFNRLGNTIRQMNVVLRLNGSRADAEAALPTALSLTVGDIPWYSNVPLESIREMNRRRFGFDAPDGVITLDFTLDALGNESGNELGDQYVYTQGLTSGSTKLTLDLPAAWNRGTNQLLIVTDDMVIPANVPMP